MLQKHKVIIIKCDNYESAAIEEAFNKIENIALNNNISLPKGLNLIIKPNLLAPDLPEKATTTHPEIFKQTAILLKKYGNKLFYADSPGIGTFADNAEVAGINAVAKSENIQPLDFESEMSVDNPSGRVFKKFPLAKNIFPDKKIFNLPKLKSHAQMLLTGAVKNIFGCVPGVNKPKLHFTMQTAENFAKMIVDLHVLIDPVFTIMDAVIGQDGNGPRAGAVKKIGYIIAGSNAFAIDIAAAGILGLDPLSIPTIKASVDCGIIDPGAIEVIGADISSSVVKGFSLPPAILPMNGLPDFIVKYAKLLLLPRPALDEDKCTRCGKCVEKCQSEPKAISLKRDRIVFDYSKCIRCYCCQEICPNGAIFVKDNRIGRFLTDFYRRVTGL